VSAIDDAELFASLRARQAQLSDENQACSQRWRDGRCKTSIGLTMPDWIRRLALGVWPAAAVGTASGGVHMANLATGDVTASVSNAHPAYLESAADQMSLLGDYDGGGITALDLSGGLIVSGGRDGVARVWELGEGKGHERELRECGTLKAGGVVSAVRVTSTGSVWVASLDGSLGRWDVRRRRGESEGGDSSPAAAAANDQGGEAEDDEATRPPHPGFEQALSICVDEPVLCAAVDDTRGLVACGMANGDAALFDSTTGTPVSVWSPHRGDRTRAVSIAHDAVITGGMDGTVRRRFLRATALGAGPAGGEDEPAAWLDNARADDELSPPHGGPVVDFAAREDALLVSAALDGSMRVWDLAPSEGITPRCLFGLLGYKVWLGSVATDGVHLVSDGSDNCVIVHDFSAKAAAEAEEEEGLDDDDDDDDDEGEQWLM